MTSKIEKKWRNCGLFVIRKAGKGQLMPLLLKDFDTIKHCWQDAYSRFQVSGRCQAFLRGFKIESCNQSHPRSLNSHAELFDVSNRKQACTSFSNVADPHLLHNLLIGTLLAKRMAYGRLANGMSCRYGSPAKHGSHCSSSNILHSILCHQDLPAERLSLDSLRVSLCCLQIRAQAAKTGPRHALLLEKLVSINQCCLAFSDWNSSAVKVLNFFQAVIHPEKCSTAAACQEAHPGILACGSIPLLFEWI